MQRYTNIAYTENMYFPVLINCHLYHSLNGNEGNNYLLITVRFSCTLHHPVCRLQSDLCILQITTRAFQRCSYLDTILDKSNSSTNKSLLHFYHIWHGNLISTRYKQIPFVLSRINCLISREMYSRTCLLVHIVALDMAISTSILTTGYYYVTFPDTITSEQISLIGQYITELLT